MPTIINDCGFRVVIYPNDHSPPHVHVKKAGQEVRVLLLPVELWDGNLPPSEARQALAHVEANHDTLLARWRDYHGDEDENDSE